MRRTGKRRLDRLFLLPGPSGVIGKPVTTHPSQVTHYGILDQRHGGFSVHNQVRVSGQEPEARKKLAGYMLRAPMFLEKMTFDAQTGTVICRSKMRFGLKRNLQVMPVERGPPAQAADWPANAVIPLT